MAPTAFAAKGLNVGGTKPVEVFVITLNEHLKLEELNKYHFKETVSDLKNRAKTTNRVYVGTIGDFI